MNNIHQMASVSKKILYIGEMDTNHRESTTFVERIFLRDICEREYQNHTFETKTGNNFDLFWLHSDVTPTMF